VIPRALPVRTEPKVFEVFELHRFSILVFLRGFSSVGQVGVRELPVTSHFSGNNAVVGALRGMNPDFSDEPLPMSRIIQFDDVDLRKFRAGLSEHFLSSRNRGDCGLMAKSEGGTRPARIATRSVAGRDLAQVPVGL
jgi:hypothetical protein